MDLKQFVILPVLGLKNDVPPDSSAMMVPVGDNVVKSHCVDGRNVDFSRVNQSCSKSFGRSKWSNTATADATQCLGIFELYDGTNRVVWTFMGDNSSKGRIFRYDGSRDPVRISNVVGHSGAIEWAYNSDDYYSVIRYGDYMVFADNLEHTPYCADHNDTALIKLISSGTEYKFKYLESWQRRIVGAYSDQTNGDIEIRWSNSLPTPGSDCEFAAVNQLFIPNDDPITGIKRMGRNNCFIYCEDSINRLAYYPNYSAPFSIVTVVDNAGGTTNYSIIDIGNRHFFFNKDYGFCQFDGNNFSPISDNIEQTIASMKSTTYKQIVGAPFINKNEVGWTLALESESYPNALLFYNYVTGQWRRKDVSVRYLNPIRESIGSLWTDLAANGITTWDDISPETKWSDLFSVSDVMAFSNTDGHIYTNKTESDNGSDLDGYRVEPIFSLGYDKSIILELWFNLNNVGNYNIYVSHRSGNTVGECKADTWTQLNEVPCNDPANAVCYLDKTARYHQLKWGTDGANEPFSVGSIEIKYIVEGRY